MKTLSTFTYCLLTLISCLLCTKLNAQSPNWLWAKSAGGTDYDYATSVTTAPGGDVYVTGYFSDTITFGSTVLTNTDTLCFCTFDIFIAKYDSSGTVLWA